jgi:hypothetical protein
MSNGLFTSALTAGAALLALWTHARYPALAPERTGSTLLHAALAFVLLVATPAAGASLATFAGIFLVLLPALVYALLSTIWVLKLAQAALGLTR